ncbi:ribonuclease HI family protein [Candidatus Berkelbacteria bacterium]|nr:ribonuclease HI family protein [Candidatus Berkelbacteria bacterium]
MRELFVYSDGGARGNPGPAGAGAVIVDDRGETLREVSQPLGTMTNNQAEYWAVILILEQVLDLLQTGYVVDRVDYRMDSQLIVEQLAGNYRVKNLGLKPLFERVRSLLARLLVPIEFSHIPRRLNTQADALANQAMDAVMAGANYHVPTL